MLQRVTVQLEAVLHDEIRQAAKAMNWSVATFIRTACIEKLRHDEAKRPAAKPAKHLGATPVPATPKPPQPLTEQEKALFAKWGAEENGGL